jgi:predicted metal-dependent HD superfamily phosphohydrolase
MNSETLLLKQTRQFAESVLLPLPPSFAYHNYRHTEAVVRAATLIGLNSGLTSEELETVLLAAWIHDVGYASIGQKGHEEQSAVEARDFLQKKGVPEARIQLVEGCILATRVPQLPQNNLEEVMCDADMYHLASADGLDRSEDLRREFSAFSGEISPAKWWQINVDFYAQHHYFTNYAKRHYETGKQQNLVLIGQRLADALRAEAA